MNENKNRKFLRWGRRIAVSLLAVCLGLVAIAGGALLFLDEGDYRDALVWAADRFLDARLEIGGPLSFHLGRVTTLSVEDVRLQAHDGTYKLAIKQFRIRQRLGSYLRTGTLWINRLVLSGVRLNVQSGRLDDGTFHFEELPPVIIEEARLSDLQIVYQGDSAGAVHEVSLQQLMIDDINNSGPIGIRGSGQVDGEPLAVSGSLGPLVDLLDRKQPYSLDLVLSSKQLEIRLAGSVADPLRGTGLDLQFTGKDARPA